MHKVLTQQAVRYAVRYVRATRRVFPSVNGQNFFLSFFFFVIQIASNLYVWQAVIVWIRKGHTRRIYIANFAIFKIATFWSYHLHLREKIAKFQFHKTSRFFGW